MDYRDILFEKIDGVAWVTINRPEVLNAFRERTLDELIDAIGSVNADPSIGVVVITGTGERAFSAGGDFNSMMKLNRQNGHLWNNRMIGLATTIRGVGVPVIAMVNGWCMGGGNELQLMCDLTIASDQAHFGQTGAKVGACPVMGATQYLPRLVGEKKAKEMIFICDRYSAQQAQEMNLINRVVPHEKLREETEVWCRKILANSPQTIRYCKVSMQFESDQLYASWAHGSELLSVVWGSEESLEGMQAFMQKRAPDFGRFRRQNATAVAEWQSEQQS